MARISRVTTDNRRCSAGSASLGIEPRTSATEIVTERANTVSSAADAHALFVKDLFERYRGALLNYLAGLLSSRADAEDVLQEAYTRLLKVEELDRTLARARAYLFKVATNLAYDRFRRRTEVSIGNGIDAFEHASVGPSPECIVDFAQGLDIVKKALLELKPRCRQVFLLRASEELSYETIAQRLGISKRTVEREMQHALHVCQRKLKRSRE